MKPSEIAAELTPAMLAQVLAKAVNGGTLHTNGRTSKLVAGALYDEHRTLQAMVIQLLINILLDYDPGPYVDLRNEQAAKSCGQLRELFEQGKFDAHIPLI